MRLWNLSHYRATKNQPSLPKCYDIDNRENTMIHGTYGDPLSPHAVFVFPNEVERLVDVCVCKLTCITDMYIIANGYPIRIRCY